MEKGTSRGPLATRYGFLGSVTGDVHTLLSTTKQHRANKTKQKIHKKFYLHYDYVRVNHINLFIFFYFFIFLMCWYTFY